MRTIARADAALSDIFNQPIQLAKIGWKWGHLTNSNSLVFLCCLARAGFSPILEFGTFTGRTTYNLALNTPDKIYTVDIGRNIDAASNLACTNYPDYVPGEAFHQDPAMRDRIELILGDSRAIDFSALYGRMGMVIVDGGHSYEVAKSDTENALRLVRSGGIIAWDDYGEFWPGVKRAVDELIAPHRLMKFENEGIVLYLR
jgi:predicted O-methyltransferase YrrM